LRLKKALICFSLYRGGHEQLEGRDQGYRSGQSDRQLKACLRTVCLPTRDPLWLEKDYLMAKKLKRLVEQLEQRITAIERALASSRVADAGAESKALAEIGKS
jgi:hypothetical protein